MEKEFIPILLFMGIFIFSGCMDQKQEVLETNVSVIYLKRIIVTKSLIWKNTKN